MLSEVINWYTTAMLIVAVLSIYGGIRLINKYFEPTEKKKNSLF
jgi:hypothetical protein